MYVLKRDPVKYLDGTTCPESYFSDSILGLPTLTFKVEEAKKFPRKADAAKALQTLGKRYSIMKVS